VQRPPRHPGERTTGRLRSILTNGAVYAASAALATLLVWLAWASLQQRGLSSPAERLHRDIVECSAAYRGARSAEDSSRALDRVVRATARPDPTEVTCRDLLFGRP
jgi:hypothetical protein